MPRVYIHFGVAFIPLGFLGLLPRPGSVRSFRSGVCRPLERPVQVLESMPAHLLALADRFFTHPLVTTSMRLAACPLPDLVSSGHRGLRFWPGAAHFALAQAGLHLTLGHQPFLALRFRDALDALCPLLPDLNESARSTPVRAPPRVRRVCLQEPDEPPLSLRRSPLLHALCG